MLAVGCNKEQPVAPDATLMTNQQGSGIENAIARSFAQQAEWPIDQEAEKTLSSSNVLAKESGGLIQGFQVQSLGHGLVHYKVIVRVGAGPYNMIGIHRVVKENAPGRPVNSRDVLFYQHGDGKDFEGMMLPGLKGSSTPIDFGMGVYLAENGVDVWGIDQAWNLVPGTVTNFDFMKNWGLQKNVDDLRLAIAVARATRFLTGCGFDRVILSGYSSGVATSVALLNEETQRSPCDRQVRGYVPVDLAIKTPPSSLKDVLAADAIRLRGLYNSGTYSYETGMPPIGMLARTAPSGDSPIFPGFTNLQAALFFGAGQIFGDPSFHYLAGVLDPTGFPAKFQFVTLTRWLEFLESGAYYEPTLFSAELEGLVSDAFPLPFDDHFSEIRVPVFNLAAKGGSGDLTIQGI
jgi:hypothetical protein